MDRGISPTVREGSTIPCPQSEPSLTVGLMPAPGNTTLGLYSEGHLSLLTELRLIRVYCCHQHLPLRSRSGCHFFTIRRNLHQNQVCNSRRAKPNKPSVII